MTYWLVIVFALLAIACRKRLPAVLSWHPLALLANILFVALIAGWIALALWMLKTWGLWGAAGILCLTGLCVVALRLWTGHWYWQDDDIMALD